MRKFICLFLTLCTLVSLVACGSPNAGDTETESTQDAQNTDIGTDDELLIVKEGLPVFTVVYTDVAYDDIALSLCTSLKQKTEVEFQCLRFAPQGSNKIMYVGYDYEKLQIEGEKLSSNGYAVVEKDGNIYFCGKSERTVGDAVDQLVSNIVPQKHVTKDENGKTVSVIVPSEVFVIFNPDYIVSDPTLLGTHIDDYRIVISKDADSVMKMQASLVFKRISDLTDFELDTVTDDKPATEREIVIGSTSRKTLEALNSDGYSIKSDGTRVYINFGSDYAFDTIYDNLRAMFGQKVLDISGTSTLDYYKREDDIRIVSYNVRAGGSDGYTPAQKCEGIAAVLRQLAPDFAGLQEAGYWQSSVSNLLSDEYGIISQTKGNIPILYRKDTWQPAEDGDGNVIKKSLQFQRGDYWGYEWVMFEKIDDPTEKIIVGNLHFCNTNEDPEWDYRKDRPEQMKAFNDEIKRLEMEYANIPLFFTGDYNTTTTMTGNATYADGWENIVGGTKLTTGMALTDDSHAYNAIDHVCTNGELVDVVRHRRVSYKVMTDLSDHLPVFIDVKLK